VGRRIIGPEGGAKPTGSNVSCPPGGKHVVDFNHPLDIFSVGHCQNRIIVDPNIVLSLDLGQELIDGGLVAGWVNFVFARM